MFTFKRTGGLLLRGGVPGFLLTLALVACGEQAGPPASPRVRARDDGVPVDGTDGTQRPVEHAERIRKLLEGVKTGSLSDRSVAIDALARSGAEASPAVPALQELLADRAGTIRVSAAVALYEISGDRERSLAVLVDVLRRGTPCLRVDASHAIGDMGTVSADGTDALISLVNGTMGEPDQRLYYDDANVHVDPIPIGWTPRSAAAYALGHAAPKSAAVRAALEALARNGDDWEREHAAEALQHLRARK